MRAREPAERRCRHQHLCARSRTSDWHPYIHLPAGFIKTFHMKSINWAYQQEPGPWTGGRSIYAPRARRSVALPRSTVTSTTAASARISTPGAARQSRLGYPDVLPYFKRLERRVGEGEDAFSRA